MPELDFRIEGAEVHQYAATPSLLFKLRVDNRGGDELRSIMLSTQIRVVPRHRAYLPSEERKLRELFGETERWGTTLNSLLWTHITTQVPAFEGSTVVDLTVPCTYDFDVVSAKYFDALEEGEIPLEFLFSGSMFYQSPIGLQVMQISWEKEANYRLPVTLWQQMMEHFFPNSAWLRLRKDAFDRLYDYRTRHGLTTWEAALESLLDRADAEVESPWIP